MGLHYLDGPAWRILRRALKHKASKDGVSFLNLRNWNNVHREEREIAKLCLLGLLAPAGGGRFAITAAGVAAADLGEVTIEWTDIVGKLDPARVRRTAEQLFTSGPSGPAAAATGSPPPAGTTAGRSGPGSRPGRMSGSRTGPRASSPRS